MFVSIESIVGALKVVAGVAIFFVWVVRYDNIKKEFEHYGLPKWVRDVVGILKYHLLLLFVPRPRIRTNGILRYHNLMFGAVYTHIRMKSPFIKYIPSVAMLGISLIILFSVI